MSKYIDESFLDNPIAYWDLDGNADNLGSLGSLVNGIYSGSPTTTSGLIGDDGSAMDFDGVDDGILIADNSSINTGGSYSQKTIELTFNADSVSGTQILYEQGGRTDGLNIYLKDNQLNLGVWASNAGEWLSYEISANKTYHVVLVFDAGELTGYVNGESIGTVSTSFSSIPGHGGDVAIGQLNTKTRFSNEDSTAESSGYHFDGTIDDVALYNTALSQERVEAHYSAIPIIGTSYNDYLEGDAGDNTIIGDGNDNVLSLDGVNDYVRTNNLTGLNTGNQVHTIEQWVYLAELPSGSAWLSLLGQNGAGSHQWLVNSNGQMQIGVYNSAQLQPTLNVGEWTHLAAVYDGATLTLYVNGEEYGSISARFNFANTEFKLGFSGDLFDFISGTERFFKGKVDDVRIWNTARSAKEISENYNKTLTGSETGLVGYWNFNIDNSGSTTIADLTGNGNDGTLVYGQGNNIVAEIIEGNDTLAGGEGNDILTGNGGADTFVFNDISEGVDTITDFDATEGDVIQITRDGFGLTEANINNFTYNSNTGALSFDGTQFAILESLVGFDVNTGIEIKDEYQEEVKSDNPIAYWRLSETTGTTAENLGSLGDAVDATYSGNPNLGASSLLWTGYGNTAAGFDGVDDGVLISNNGSINTGGSYSQKTIELTFNADRVSGKQILYEQGGTARGLNIYLEDNQLKLGAWVSGSGEWLSYDISANTTYNVVLVFDSGELTGYVNGESIGTVTTSFTSISSHGGNIAIGQLNNDTRFSNTDSTTENSGYYFDGIIDDIALYNTALSGVQVQSHFETAAISQNLRGSSDNDILAGGTGDDTINGGAGDDVISGNGGEDILTGGTGADDFVFTEVSNFVDKITDFDATEGDKIYIASSFGATSLDQFSFDGMKVSLTFNGNPFISFSSVTNNGDPVASLPTNYSFDLANTIIIQQSFTIDENSTNGTNICSVAINNPAASNPYQIVSGNEDGIFALNTSTGEITIADSNQLNYEAIADTYQLELQVTDANNQIYTKQVAIKVTDVNETPVLSNYNFSVVEESAVGTVIGTVAATDPDAGDSLYYKITSGNDDNIFDIDPLTGEISIGANSNKLDYETLTSHSLNVRVTDSEGETDTATVAIDVTDANEAPIMDKGSYLFYVNNFGTQSSEGAFIGKISASDQNNDNLTYSITAGNDDNFFAIDSSGNISINPNLSSTERQNLIKNTNRSFDLTVTVSDGELTDTARVFLDKSTFKDVFRQDAQNNVYGAFFSNGSASTTPTLADVDNDGDLDSFLGYTSGKDTSYANVNYYENVNGEFSLEQGSIIKFAGSDAKPAFADINNDGNIDAIVGSSDSTIRYYQGDGNGNFTEQTGSNNPFDGLSITGTPTPAFADIDNDGDLDAFVGHDSSKGDASNGNIYYYENNNGTFSKSSNNGKYNDGLVASVNSNASPTFADINNDGYLDLVVGTGNGTLKYFENDGTGSFTKQTGSNNPFDGIDIGEGVNLPEGWEENAAPVLGDINGDSYLDLLIGTGFGQVYYYQGTSGFYDVTFSSTGQSTWGSGNSIQTAFDWEPFDPIDWDYTFDIDLGLVEFGGGTAGDFHFRTGYEIDSGTIDSTLPFEVMLNAPSKVAEGDVVTISTAYELSDTAEFTTTTPYVNAYLDLGLMFYLGAYATIDYGIGKETFDIADALGTNIDYSIDFEFDTRDGSYSETFYDFADFTLEAPDIAVDGVITDDNTLSGSAKDVFLSTEISIDDLLVENFLKESTNPYMQALGNAWQNDIDIGVAGIEWDLLDLDLVGDISVRTSYDLTFDSITGQVLLEDGTTSNTFTMGNDVSFDVLTGMDTNNNGQLDYDLKLDLVNPELTTKVDIIFDVDFDIAALQGRAWYDVWLSSGSKDFGPLFDDSFDIAKGSMTIFNDTFALGGFGSQYINDLAVEII